MEDFPLSISAETTVSEARCEADDIISGKSDRIIVIIGPCSIHDVDAAKEYAEKLLKVKESFKSSLLIIMRVYFEKPRTSVGWKGLINDPLMDGTFKINTGLKVARGLLLDINGAGMPTAGEFLDTLTPQYVGDLIAWGAIGARTTESQVHRELASGISAPIGFKNGTDGNIKVAVDAILAASSPHHFLSVTKQGLSAIVETSGNQSCHVILRGSNEGPNYSSTHVKQTVELIEASFKSANLSVKPHVMIDCSHGNSEKKFQNQRKVVESVCSQLETAGPSSGYVMGVMIESNINEGNQKLGDGKNLKYGVSVTDACVGWEETVALLQLLANSVEKRDQLQTSSSSLGRGHHQVTQSQISQVSQLFPHYPTHIIESDLSRTGSVELTCENILNNVLRIPPQQHQQQASHRPAAAQQQQQQSNNGSSGGSAEGVSSFLKKAEFEDLPSVEPKKVWEADAKGREEHLKQRKLFMLNLQRQKYLEKQKSEIKILN